MRVRHSKVSGLPDTDDEGLVQASDWNGDHVIDCAARGSAMLAQGQTLTVPHAPDAQRMRLVQVLAETVAMTAVTPSLAGPDDRASASSVYGDVTHYQPWCAYRHDTAPGQDQFRWWLPASNAGEWIAWDFGAPVGVSGLSFCCYAAQYGPQKIKAQGSADGAVWSDLLAVDMVWATAGYQTMTFAAAVCRYVRLFVVVGGVGGYISVAGLRFSQNTETLKLPAPTDYAFEFGESETRVRRLAAGSETVVVTVLV